MENNRPLGWTTLEEAKKLVEAGLDPNTADMSFAEAHLSNVDLDVVDTASYSKTKDYDDLWERFPCWSLGALVEISVKIIKNDYYFLSSAKDFAYSHLLNSVSGLMQKHDSHVEALVCFLLGLLKQTTSKDNFVDNAEKDTLLTPEILKDNGFLDCETSGNVEAYEFYETPVDIVVEYINGHVCSVFVSNGSKTFEEEPCDKFSVQELERAMNICGIVKPIKF